MCVVCGCSDPTATHSSENQPSQASLGLNMSVDPKLGDLHFGAGAARVSVPGLSQERAIKIEEDILGANNRIAQHNRQHFVAHGVTALNMVSSPGSGKTTLLCASIEALKRRHPKLAVAVIEGDQQTTFDADRIRATGAPAIQVNTGKGCHLDAPMIASAFEQLHHHHHHHHYHHHHHHHDRHHDHDHGDGDRNGTHAHTAPTDSTDTQQSLLFIENVGNLVCPAMWDLGEQAKVVVLSVTEGEDKPLKYPDMFAASALMILNKIDLLPHVRFDTSRCIQLARQVNPQIEVLMLSATTGEGMEDWLRWLEVKLTRAQSHHSIQPAAVHL